MAICRDRARRRRALILQRTRLGSPCARWPTAGPRRGVGHRRRARDPLHVGSGAARSPRSAACCSASATRSAVDMGFTLLLLMFAAVVLGGLGTAYGAMVGGLIIGVTSQVSTYWISTEVPHRRRARRPHHRGARAAAGHPRRRNGADAADGHLLGCSRTRCARPSVRSRPRTRSPPIGLNLQFGYTGLLNFGQVAFLHGRRVRHGHHRRPGRTALARVPRRHARRGAARLLFGLPTLRLRADYLAIVTVARGRDPAHARSGPATRTRSPGSSASSSSPTASTT